MKILVCIKPVPASDAPVCIAAGGKSVQAEASSPFRINRYDEPALEQALLIRDAFPGTRIEVISVGPKRSETILKRALGMGADHGIHICTQAECYLSPAVIAAWITAVAGDRTYDLLFTGVMSEDGMHGQVGPRVAEQLSLPCATAVVLSRIAAAEGTVQVERVLSEGLRESLQLNLPALLTIQGGLAKTRYPSLSNILRAKEQELEIFVPVAPEQPDSRQTIVRFKYPQKSRSGRTLTGSPREKAQEFLRILQEKALLG